MNLINDLVEYKIKQNKGDMVYFYIHIPRTSGTSIKKKLEEYKSESNIITSSLIECNVYKMFCEQHSRLIDLKNQIKNENLQYVKFFTVVRNPYDRLFSLWSAFKAENYKNISYSLESFLNISSSFDEFVQNYCNSDYDEHYYLESQLFYLEGEEIENIKILKYENRNEIITFLNNNGVEYDNTTINRSKDKKISYTETNKDMIYSKFEDEFLLFNYSK